MPWPATIETSALLGPGGEFAFIVIGLAMAKKIVEPGMGEMVLALTSFSMAHGAGARLLRAPLVAQRHRQRQAADPALSLPPPQERVDAIVIGCGRVGALVSEMLTRHGVKHIIVERDPAAVARCREEGFPVYFGDAKNPLFLKRCGIEEAKGVVITINKPSAVGEIVSAVREMRDDIIIVARARDAEHARQLYKQNVSDAVPETIEASLQLSEATLVGLGVPTARSSRRSTRSAMSSASSCRGGRPADARTARQPV